MTGWINETTYRVSTVGIADDSGIMAWQRKRNAKNNAVINARAELNEIFSSGEKNGIKRIIRDGNVIYENYDRFGNCEIIYEIRGNSLRNRLR